MRHWEYCEKAKCFGTGSVWGVNGVDGCEEAWEVEEKKMGRKGRSAKVSESVLSSQEGDVRY